MAGFSPTYPVGGVIDEVKKVNFPPHLFPTKSRPWTKGFRMEIPPTTGMFELVYVPTVDLELIDVGLACSGYGDEDYWELQVGTEKIIETMYTKELPQHINMGTTLYTIERIPAGTPLKMQFHNSSASTKTVWFDFRFLK
jgi:hypothetical protein